MTDLRARRTLTDWLRHAHAAESAGEVAEARRCFEAAAALASSCYEQRSLLAGGLELRAVDQGRLTALADRLLQSAIEEGHLWGFRDVATARHATFDDPEGARAALEAGHRAFGQKGARGYEWALLAEGYAKTLGDAAGVRSTLEAGREAARTRGEPDDLANVAIAWASLLDREEGAALLHEAERLAGDDEQAPWPLANAWRALGDAAAVRRVLDAALGRAKTATGALQVARAWASHAEPDEARRALVRTRELASTADEWLAIGEVVMKKELGVEQLREAVEHAEAAATDADRRARVSSAYANWLGDEAAARRVGPHGERPEASRQPARQLAGWAGSAAGLFDWLCSRATDETLVDIARADYGIDEAQHLATLRTICASGLVPRPLLWEPREVLQLTRWTSGEHVDHLARALCCTLLCLAGDDSGLMTNGPILVESCLALGQHEATREALPLAIAFFVWLCETNLIFEGDDQEEEAAPDADALLLLLLLGLGLDPNDAKLVDLAELLQNHPDCPPETLTGCFGQTIRLELWRELVEDGLASPHVAHPSLVALWASFRAAFEPGAQTTR